MNIFLTLRARIQLAHKRRQIRTIEEFERHLEDQVVSGQASLKYWRERRRKLEAEAGLLEAPDAIVRRLGVGA